MRLSSHQSIREQYSEKTTALLTDNFHRESVGQSYCKEYPPILNYLREQVFQACQELLEEEKSVTVRAVIDRVGGSSRDISPIVKEFKEKLEQESSIAVSEKAEVNTNDSNEEEHIDTNPVTANLERVDKEAQLIAARKIVATAYYEKTQQFNLPGLQEEVNQALSEVDAIAHNQDETLSPKGMLNWLKGRQKQPQY